MMSWQSLPTITMQHQYQQQRLLEAARKKKKASPWWDFFSHCLWVESDSEDDEKNEDMSHADYDNGGCATNPTNDDDVIKPAPLSPSHIVRTPRKLISTQSNDTADGYKDKDAGKTGK